MDYLEHNEPQRVRNKTIDGCFFGGHRDRRLSAEWGERSEVRGEG